MTDDATRADKIDVDREHGVTVVFGDGRSCFFPNDDLRAACPCAECRGLRDRGSDVWPKPGGPVTARIEGAELVGLWGIGIAWNDGHATGIYPWSSLREWCDREAASP